MDDERAPVVRKEDRKTPKAAIRRLAVCLLSILEKLHDAALVDEPEYSELRAGLAKELE